MCPFNQGGKILEALYNFQMSVMVHFSPVLNLDQFKASTIELGQCVYLSPLRRNAHLEGTNFLQMLWKMFQEGIEKKT